MKKYFKFPLYLLMGAVAVCGFASCSDDDGVALSEKKEKMFKDAIVDYVDNTVIPTYRGMADNAILLADACNKILTKFNAGELSADDVKAAGEYWNKSRDYWEKSEAFLYGPVAVANIDPHIDSWPLDKVQMDDLLVDIREGRNWNAETLGPGLLGFHAIEYMLFELSTDGTVSNPHNVNYTKEELLYLVAVAEDLRNQCVLLEAAWVGVENLSDAKSTILADAELEVERSIVNYGWQMKNAGAGGSNYVNYLDAAQQLVEGCATIADEVANTKIGTPALGLQDEDDNYIESPYSLNSINDFVGNIISIENAYQGSKAGDASISDFIKIVDPELDSMVKELIAESKEAIVAIGEPFVSTSNTQAAIAAMEVVNDLYKLLDERVYTALTGYDFE